MSCEKNRKLDTFAKLLQAISETTVYVGKTIGQLEVRTPRKLKKSEQMNYENSPQQI